MASTGHRQISGIRALLRDDRFWKVAFQVIVVVGVITAFSYLAGNLNNNMSQKGTQFGFGFLDNPAGFAIGESLVDYRAQDVYLKAIQAGIVNSLRVMIVGIVLATVVGITAGVASFSDNWLMYKISRAYVGLVRNVPLLLQLFFWYLAVFFSLPRPENQIVLPGGGASWAVLNKRGIYLPGPSFTAELWTGLILLVLSLLLIGLLWRSIKTVRRGFSRSNLGSMLSFAVSLVLIPVLVIAEYLLLFNTGRGSGLYFKGAILSLVSSAQGLWLIALVLSVIPLVLLFRWRTKAIVEQGRSGRSQLLAIAAIAVVDLVILLFALGWQPPEILDSGGLTGGLRLSLEYAAIVSGLVFYTGAFIAEIVRAGIQSVSKGQWEAARSLGLTSGLAMRMVVFPQALRVIIPPLNSEFMNLAKNSSLALAVGYPDLYSVANTTFNQTGRPVEVFMIMMATYLVINLLISVNMNQLNSAVQFKER
ncbi:MAG: ABC transporter permease subunit [Leptolyngbya sp. SIO4C1]|nr:ABC transporter permease subunit [Leptolyngbya sp. SIO4C1]